MFWYFGLLCLLNAVCVYHGVVVVGTTSLVPLSILSKLLSALPGVVLRKSALDEFVIGSLLLRTELAPGGPLIRASVMLDSTL